MRPHGQKPEAPAYEPTTWGALAKTVKNQSAAAVQLQRADARISLAGAQDKASIAIFDGKTPLVPKASASSTHILKPDIQGLAKVTESAANKAFIMRAVAHGGLNTAKVFYEPVTQTCLVERFDRFSTDGTLGRLVQCDFCQGVTCEGKYEKEGGCASRYARRSSANAAHVQRRTCRPSRIGSSSTSTWATTTAMPRTSRSTNVRARGSA